MLVYNVVGTGATGGEIVRQLVKSSINSEEKIHIHLWDFDHVEMHNLQNQVFSPRDLGKSKTESLVDEYSIYPTVKFFQHGRYYPKTGTTFEGSVFLCVDSVELTKKILEDIIEESSEDTVVCMTRIGTREAQVYTSKARNLIKYCQFKDNETEEEISPCGTKINVLQTAIFASTIAVQSILESAIDRLWYLNQRTLEIKSFAIRDRVQN